MKSLIDLNFDRLYCVKIGILLLPVLVLQASDTRRDNNRRQLWLSTWYDL